METNTFTLSSGRVVGVTEFGNRESDVVVVFAHAAPGASNFDPNPEQTVDHHVRVIALDRPGYGLSEHISFEAPTVYRAAADIAEYLAAEGITSVGAAGWSAGGRVVLALAAANPNLVSRLALIGTPAPDDEVPWVGDDNRAMIRSFDGLTPSEAVDALTSMFDEFNGAEPNPHDVAAQLATPEVDDPVLAGAEDRLVLMAAAASTQGNIGTAADVISYTFLDLGFSISDVHAETLLLYGGSDGAVGPEHASWYDKHLMNAHVEIVPDAGHLLVIPVWGEVLDFLAPGSRTG